MAIATDPQCQVFSDTRMRPRAEAFRNLAIAMEDDAAVITDVFNAANQGSPTWHDSRTDVPHQNTNPDILAYNSVVVLFGKIRAGTATLADVANFSANFTTMLNFCVRAPGV